MFLVIQSAFRHPEVKERLVDRLLEGGSDAFRAHVAKTIVQNYCLRCGWTKDDEDFCGCLAIRQYVDKEALQVMEDLEDENEQLQSENARLLDALGFKARENLVHAVGIDCGIRRGSASTEPEDVTCAVCRLVRAARLDA